MTKDCNSMHVLHHDAALQAKRPVSFADTKNWWWKVSTNHRNRVHLAAMAMLRWLLHMFAVEKSFVSAHPVQALAEKEGKKPIRHLPFGLKFPNQRKS